MSTAAAATYQGTFGGRADEADRLRREITGYLGDCPGAADIVLIADELAANAIMHSRSRGGSFAVRCEVSPGAARVEASRQLRGGCPVNSSMADGLDGLLPHLHARSSAW